MEEEFMDTMGWSSLVPIVTAIVLALWSKNTVFSLSIACIIGCFMAGKGIWGFTDVLQSSLGNEDFIWAALNILFFGVLCTYYEKSGAIDGFTRIVNQKNLKRRGVQFLHGHLVFSALQIPCPHCLSARL